MRIVLLACSKSKQKTNGTLPARDLYTGSLFKESLSYAENKLNPTPDRIYILSALHHLVELNQPLCYYNLCLRDLKAAAQKAWAEVVKDQLIQEGCKLQNDEFIFLTGRDYYIHLLPYLNNYMLPMANAGCRGYGDMLHWLQNHNGQIPYQIP